MKNYHKHIIADVFECEPECLLWSTSEKFRNFIKDNVGQVATIINESWHTFDNDAYTGTILLAESHFSIHTWPENKSVNIDLFTCGNKNPELAINAIINYCNDDINTIYKIIVRRN
jgi:S-adenosylmethionine decarboxylase proenzyme